MSLIQFKDLLQATPVGVFFLQNELVEYTTPEYLSEIINAVTKIRNDYVTITTRSFSPSFIFTMVVDKLRITIIEKQFSGKNIKVGYVDLIAETFGNNNIYVLKLDIPPINPIKKPKAIELFEAVISEDLDAFMQQPEGKCVYSITCDEVVVFANAIKKLVLDTKTNDCFPECSNTYHAMEINKAIDPYKKRIAELELLLNIRATM